MDRLVAALECAVETRGQVLELHAGPIRILIAADHAHQSDAVRARGAQADAGDDILAGARGEAVEISGDRQDRFAHHCLSGLLELFGSPAMAASTASPSRSTIVSISAARRDVGRRDDDVVALLAVDRAAHRIAGQAARDGLRLDALVQLQRRIEDRLGGAVGDELQRPEQAAAANVADMAVVAEAFLQGGLQRCAHRADVVQQVVLADDSLHLQRGGAGDRMRLIGLAVQEAAGPVGRSAWTIRSAIRMPPIGW